jgi:DNA-binding response OmpR family regulator
MMTKTVRVLLIDDEPHLLFGLRAVLKRAGFEILTASNGELGLECARQEHPDIIVCDMMMPSLNGLQVKQLLADDPSTAHIPFIFLTARPDIEDKLAGLSSGADDYIIKPFVNVAELIERIRAVLRRYEAGRQQGLAEAEEKIDQLQRFLHMTAQLVAQNGEMVEQPEFTDDHGEATNLYSRANFENRLDSLDDAAMFPVGIVVFQVHDLNTLDSQVVEKRVRQVVAVLKTAMDTDQLVFKMGADEFVVLLPRVDDFQIDRTLVCVRAELDQYNSAEPAHPLALQMGIAVGEYGSQLSAVLQQAETRMQALH